jgi:hypothetical protein
MINALFCEVNPIPVKEAMNLMGKEVGPYRQPLCEMAPENRELLQKGYEGLRTARVRILTVVKDRAASKGKDRSDMTRGNFKRMQRSHGKAV